MIRKLTLCALVLCYAAPAHAQFATAFLKWNNCAAEGGVLEHNFDCDSNTGTEELIGSFVMTDATLPVVGIEAVIDIAGQDFLGIADPFGAPPIPFTPLGSWWDLRQPLGARSGALSVSTTFSEPPFSDATQCTDYWAGQAVGGSNYTYALGGDLGRARLALVFAVPPGATAIPVDGLEYYAFRATLGHSKTVGPGHVDGCCTKVVLMLVQMKLNYGDGSATIASSGYFDAAVSRQHQSTACIPVPVRNQTWGGLKQLYR